MLIESTGRYITKAGKVVYVTSTDGYRRAWGKDSHDRDISWYTENGNVRSGTCNGNNILVKVDEE